MNGNRVNAVARRKIALVFLLLFLFLLLLSPWATAPSPAEPPAPAASGTPAQAVLPAAEAETPVPLKVEAALNEEEFRLLEKQNEENAFRFPDLVVELDRVPPEQASLKFRRSLRNGEAADVMLLASEDVEAFAVSGFLKPVDGAFVGEALSEQFEALSSAVKWNGYLWAVPKDFDPYVVVWRLTALRQVLGETANPPLTLDQWTELAVKSSEAVNAAPWLAIDSEDPLAFLTWLQSATGERTDTLWSEGGQPWKSDGAKGKALTLLDQSRQGVVYGHSADGTLLSAGAAATVMPFSAAVRLGAGVSGTAGSEYAMDRSAWKQPYVWPRGRSFAVSSRSKVEEAARRWIAAMTDIPIQEENERLFAKLPVYRSLYRVGSPLSSLFEGSSSSAFPNQAPAAWGPELPARLQRAGGLWREWTAGRLTPAEWERRWPETSADFQLDD